MPPEGKANMRISGTASPRNRPHSFNAHKPGFVTIQVSAVPCKFEDPPDNPQQVLRGNFPNRLLKSLFRDRFSSGRAPGLAK